MQPIPGAQVPRLRGQCETRRVRLGRATTRDCRRRAGGLCGESELSHDDLRGFTAFRVRISSCENADVARYVELRRHTDADGDVLTQEGVRMATEIGARLNGGYDLLVSTGAQRATQTLACFLAALGERVAGGVVVETGLRSESEQRWREVY